MDENTIDYAAGLPALCVRPRTANLVAAYAEMFGWPSTIFRHDHVRMNNVIPRFPATDDAPD